MNIPPERKPDSSSETSDRRHKKTYVKPVLNQHGDVSELTKSEYGGLDRLVYGSLFAMSSPGIPGAPSR